MIGDASLTVFLEQRMYPDESLTQHVEGSISNSSSRIMVLGSTQPLTETSTRDLPGGKCRSARKDDNRTAIC
jgi:hypothetical protein